jgi:aminopeptidase N
VPSLLRGFSAPVKLRFDYSEAELQFLMAHDSDGFSRWDAAQTLMQGLLLRLVAEPDAPIPESFLAAFRRALLDNSGDAALRAEVLTLPSESYLADQMAVVDVDGIHRAREQVRRRVGEALGSELAEVYAASQETGPYGFSPQGVARRSLKNLALGYLMAGPQPGALELCRVQFEAAHNMTDVMAALGRLVDLGGPEAESALDCFYVRWSAEPLVIDKWFSLQATSHREDALERVQALLGHPDFSMRNPNRVRSLIGAFATGNPVRFHGTDGAGYRFLADRVLELDPLNPQIASRLLRGLIRWRRFDPGRQDLMRAELERVLRSEPLSKDSYEVASKALEAT